MNPGQARKGQVSVFRSSQRAESSDKFRCGIRSRETWNILINTVPKSVPGTRCGVGNNAGGYSVIVDATGTEVLLAFGADPQTSRAVAEFVVRSL